MELLIRIVLCSFGIILIYKSLRHARNNRLPKIEVGYSPAPKTKVVRGMDNALKFAGGILITGGQVYSVGDDGEDVAGVCEGCRRAILEDELYYYDNEGVIWHKPEC